VPLYAPTYLSLDGKQLVTTRDAPVSTFSAAVN